MRHRTTAALALCAVSLAACSETRGTAAGPTPTQPAQTTSTATFCAAIKRDGSDEHIDLGTTSRAQIKAQAAAAARKLDAVLPLAPASLKRALTTMDNAQHQLAQTGDAGPMFALAFDPDIQKMVKTLRTLCGFPAITTTTTAPASQLAQAACRLLTPAEVSAYAGRAAPAPKPYGSTGCSYQIPVPSGTLLIGTNIFTDSFFLPSASRGDHVTPEPQLGDHGAVSTSSVGLTECVGGKPGKWFQVSLGGATANDTGNKPWAITTAAQRAALAALCEHAVARL